jgi:hypothetical protein
MNQKRPDGYWTVGMLDFEVVLPDNQAIECAAMCNDISYPDANRGGSSDRVPISGN